MAAPDKPAAIECLVLAGGYDRDEANARSLREVVMEYLDGLDLETELETRDRLPVTEAVDLVIQALDGISAAHALGIVHRDLKPATLFVTLRSDGTRRGRPRKVDLPLPTEAPCAAVDSSRPARRPLLA